MSSYSALDNSSHSISYGGIDIRGINDSNDNDINLDDGSGDDSDGYNGNNDGGDCGNNGNGNNGDDGGDGSNGYNDDENESDGGNGDDKSEDSIGGNCGYVTKSKVHWKSVDGAFTKQRRLHLVKDRDGLDHCPVTGCEHPGFASQRGCRKHVKIKHGWYYYFDEKPNVSIDLFDTSPSAANGTNEKASRTVPGCFTDN
ncbi:Hypothetical predicted protein [Paramuricea clavata]|uniref:Uncharacterized protein n=1 Tax=Paramuricea clavata TaxID=317549 RepID=A0A7D9KZQ8_PARCT|nr:Hypothetical predicted protein [Paramuricea clavata]